MNKYLSIIVYDLKNTRRDPTLLLLLWMPLLMIFVIRHGIPALASYVPSVTEYSLEIVSFFALLNAIFPGFVLAFILLDEKDLNLMPVINITPVSLSGFLITRIVFLSLYGFLCSWIVFAFNGQIAFPPNEMFASSLLCALNMPIIILFISTKAKNKIEGLTILKAANVTLMLPIIVFFIESPWENILAIFPAFWLYKFIGSSNLQGLIFALGILYLVALNYFTFAYAKNKNI
jgi:hypothetical protein